MANKFIPFPKIHGFDHVVEEVEYNRQQEIEEGNEEAEYPKISFVGRVKIHGTNGAIIMRPDGHVYCQGRNKLIDSEDDFKFYSFCQNKKFPELFDQLKEIYFNQGGEEDIDSSYIALFGEYAGKGIQSKVGICNVDKLFIIFAIKLVFEDKSKNVWLNLDEYSEIQMPKERVFNVSTFPSFKITIDFSKPEESISVLKNLTNNIEKECPVTKSLGSKGKGEGLVWSAIGTDYYFTNVFKTKHDSFMATRKDNVSLSSAVIESVKKFVDMTVTENRLNQGLDFLKEEKLDLSLKSARAFSNWIADDILVEEESTIEKSKLDENNLRKKIIETSKAWFLKKYNDNAN